jgi:hypothetical protein
MVEFLTFQHFISLDILIIMYSMGLFGMPLVAGWIFWKIKPYLPWGVMREGVRVLSLKERLLALFLFLFLLLCMEIVWRMMCEFLIAYMQIRNVIVGS